MASVFLGDTDLGSGPSGDSLWGIAGGFTMDPSDGYSYSPPSNGITTWDAADNARFGGFYPPNGQPFDWNAALYGVTRAVDTATRAYVNIKGAQAASYAGQNGLTYFNGRNTVALGGNMIPLLLIGGALILLMK